MRRARAIAAVLALGALLPAASAAAQNGSAPTRYSLANGCYTLVTPDGQPVPNADRVRMQATALGRYLLYRPDGRFVAVSDQGTTAAQSPSPAADWRVDDAAGDTFTLTPQSSQARRITVRFQPATGCAAYPEAELNATGRPGPAPTPYGKVGGLVEGHMHWMTYEYFGRRFHCGRPWHAYGIPHALPDCSDIEGPQGTAAPLQNFLNYGNPARPHDTRGYPYMTEWSPNNLTYEGTYWRWIERAWLGGLRLMVMGVNENRLLCQLQANRETNCNEMDTMRRGFAAIKELEDYVDAQAGGPGKGFFQIVTDPYEAREVINQGRMAVVLEIETSEPLDCIGWENPSCDRAQVDRQLEEMHKLGVRSMLLLNKFDNPLVGVRFDSGPAGVIINGGNRLSSGTYWSARTCREELADNEIYQPNEQTGAFLDSLLTSMGVPSGTYPAYPPPPHCNTRGLTPLGRHLVRRMMDLKMIVNPDHMSQAGVDDTITLLESRRYSGVISPHGWMDPGNWPRLWKLGGMAFPGHSDADDYVREWREFRPAETPYEFGWGYGADLGGLSHQPDVPAGPSISYPFKSYDGQVTFDRQRTGLRTFDYTKDGVAHYGLYPEWFADLKRLGGQTMADDMWNGAEAYLQMWERADGVPVAGCHEPISKFAARGRGPMRLGVDWKTLLRGAGQPQQRTRTWTWCIRGQRSPQAADVVELSEGGEVELVGSAAKGRKANGIRVGARTRSRAVRRLRSAGGGVRFRRNAVSAWVYAVRKGRVRAVGVASHGLVRRRADLRAAMRRLLAARATQSVKTYRPAAGRAASRGRLTGRTLAGTTNPRLNAKLELLCRLQV